MNLLARLADESTPVVIGEIGQNHDGSLGMARAYIDALADAGADVVKFQAHIANRIHLMIDEFIGNSCSIRIFRGTLN